MAGSDENCAGGARPSNIQGDGKSTAEIRPTRKALSTINQNNVRAAPYPSAATKRGTLQEKKAICGNNVDQIPVFHRPVTRMLDAQIAAKQHEISAEEIKQPVIKTDCSVIDLNVYKARDSFPEPMLAQHDLKDDEMDVIDANDMDIDGDDKKDTIDVVEYMDDLYKYYRNVENSFCVPPNYMASQLHINEKFRGILIDWLIEVHCKFDLRPETLYLTVNLIDRFLAMQPVVRKTLQLVGVTALLLASKYEEPLAPFVKDLILISDNAYTRNEVLQMEKLMINKFHYDFSVPTVYLFAKRFLKAAQSDSKTEFLAFYIIDLCLVEYEMVKYPPSMLAAAAVFTAQCTLGKAAQWSKMRERQTQYKAEDIMKCSRLMVEFHQNAAKGKLTAVYRKYNTSNYGYAANIEPAQFLLGKYQQ
ncbi:G2/mitotic-specific cyclin-2-like [Apium graveolens]|uniref:G2/mitotic-specific cyclin-2-like n=1 Tax=Apium graveolens TaxID=4045 RepID=UPI003D7B5F99